MQFISTPEAPLALGHYSQAVEHNGTIYVSGQLPLDPADETRPLGTIREQTLQTLKNVEAILLAAGSSKTMVLKATVYMTDLALWPEINAAYAEFFGEHRPARAAVPISALPKGCQIEIDVLAAKIAGN